MTANSLAVMARGIRKNYGDKRALDGFDLSVPQGRVCGLLGPNGAGKTTAVRILATLLKVDGGEARVAGYDVVRDAAQVRHRIGLVGQNHAVDEVLSGYQNLVLFGRLYHLPISAAKRRATDLLDQFDLADTGNKQVKAYSGGMRRRLDLAASMILAPAVLFLDEPTTGLDPRGRNEVWRSIRELVDRGTTVLLTTQYLDEADQLADQISVIAAGKVIAEGPPSELKSQIGGDRVDVVLHNGDDLTVAAHALARLSAAEPHVDVDNRLISVKVGNRANALTNIVRVLDELGAPIDDLALRRPTLDDVFMQITGQFAHTERHERDEQTAGEEVEP
ncbi:ATP-binding cassette domain-containing protein [Nocardia wallacei]|uniref:ATP-binding cassette domain-containing protein n=1 Tax=Nocardia wallacei TaxID=480035 RepID=UPI002457C41A|nr:ATP-binding cassette domain-containing protein [Nocardia wallacei]